MSGNPGSLPGRIWSLGWVLIVRFILYLLVASFFLQYIYFGQKGQFYQPGTAVICLVAAFIFNLTLLALGNGGKWHEELVAVTYIVDVVVVTRCILSSGGLNSILIPFYLPVMVMAAVWLPRRFTAVFPSIATLGVAYIGFAHLVVSVGGMGLTPRLYLAGSLDAIRYSSPHTIVATMLVLSVLFFVISYFSGTLSDRLFLEQRLNAEVLSSMKEGVAVVNQTGEVLYVNEEFRRIFPLARLGSDFTPVARQMLQPDGTGPTLGNLVMMDLSETITMVRENMAGDPTPPLEIRLSGIRPRGRNHIYALVFLVSDLTLRRRMERAERNLERFSAISTMSAGLAHEIRNPLAALRSAIQEIGRCFPEGSQNRMLTNIVLSESDRLDGIIARFLDFSREGQLRIHKCRLGPILRDVITLIGQDSTGSAMKVFLEIRDDPEVACDKDRIQQVFYNLALNAAQEMAHPGAELTVAMDLAARQGCPGVEVLFQDNGPGIPEDEMPRVFEPFFTTKAGGTGMGLAISRKQVTMHGGDIDFSNNPGAGACFRIWLPLDQSAAASRPGATRIVQSGRFTARPGVRRESETTVFSLEAPLTE